VARERSRQRTLVELTRLLWGLGDRPAVLVAACPLKVLLANPAAGGAPGRVPPQLLRALPRLLSKGVDDPHHRVIVLDDRGQRLFLVVAVGELIGLEAHIRGAAQSFELSPAETEVLLLHMEGLVVGQIAGHRGTSVSTADAQLKRIVEKLGVKRREQIAEHIRGFDARRSA
jgi:DNA-binding CsgD family transcriptional regulator